ncbi:MAG: response regulator [Fibrella sp.]|nr:response regulator [Armatimonadota bacterium]
MNRKVVAVDNEAKVIRQVVDVLLRDEYVAITAENGADAVSKVRTEQPWLIVLGKELPDMPGKQMLECLGITPASPTLALGVIMLSRPTWKECSESFGLRPYPDAPGMYLFKPFNPMELRQYIRYLREQMQKVNGNTTTE